jgi:RNA polymerase sigma factor (sigma-70 family)
MTQLAVLRTASVVEGALRLSLHRFVEGRLRHRADSEDVVQEIYVRLYDYERTRTIGNVGAFCFKVARNLVHDHLRSRRATGQTAELTHEIACPAPRVDEILAYRERVDVLILALKAMPALRREVFTRRRLEEQPVATIARDLGMTVGAVEKHCGRALTDLRSALDRRGLGLDKGA